MARSTDARDSIDIGEMPEVVRLAREVHDSGQPVLLREAGVAIAALIPLELAEELGLRGPLTEAEIAAFESAAGGWHDVDTDRLLEDIYARRGRPVRPPVE